MSFEIFVQRFQAGSRATFSRSHFDRIFSAHVIAQDMAHGCTTLGYTDGDCDVYMDNCEEIHFLTVNRPSGVQLFNGLFCLMKEVGAIAYWPDRAPALAVADPKIVTDLPSSMLAAIGPAVTVFSGSDIMAAIAKS